MIKEIIVVEGRDDTAAIKRALEADTIETHGYGISAGTWKLLQRAYESRGLIIFTDPDYAGNEIRRRLKEQFPDAKHAYLDRDKARDKDDIGIENASPEAIIDALKKARGTVHYEAPTFTMEDMIRLELAGTERSARLRAMAGDRLGIGTGNSKAFLKKLNAFGITKEELESCIKDTISNLQKASDKTF